MPDPSDDESLTGEVLLERYAVGSRVARGGFAAVYRGRHLELDVPVALKVLAPRDGDASSRAAWLALFRQEARTLAALGHPAIVRVYDAGVVERASESRAWMALEWLDGVTLDDDLRDRAGVGRSPREALELLRPAFDGLAFAHDAGVSHRDVKPSNVMLVKAARGAPPLRVIDFGIAKADDTLGPSSGATATGASLVAFSAAYAAPEQVTRTRTGPWTDVHALALVVTEVVTGERPYGDAQGAGVVEAILRSERPTPGRAGVDVGPWEAVLARALARLPSDRPQTAGALWAELSSCVEEAQAAWAANPPAKRVASPARAEETLAPTEGTSAPTPAAVASAAAAPARPSRVGVVVAAAVISLVAVLALAAAMRTEPSARAATAPTPTTVFAPVPAPVLEAPAPATTPAVAAPVPVEQPTAPLPARPRLPVRRVARAAPAADAGARTSAPAAAPRLVVE